MINLLSEGSFSYPKNLVKVNEDSILSPKPVGSGYLMPVADGVGSYPGAERASKEAIRYISRMDYSELHESLKDETLFSKIKKKISSIGNADPYYFKAATTLTLCFLTEEGVYIGHVGDCRAYIKIEKYLEQITKDHTQYQILLDSGIYTKPELKSREYTSTLVTAISNEIELQSQVEFIPYYDCCDGNGYLNIYIMSDGAHRWWEARPRFAENTLIHPNRFASSLQNRIFRLGAQDDFSLVAARFMIKNQLRLF